MSKSPFKIENLDIFQPLSAHDSDVVTGGLTLAPRELPSDEPKGDDSLPHPSGPFYPLPLPCYPSKPFSTPIGYPCGCSPYPTKNGLPWCAVIL